MKKILVITLMLGILYPIYSETIRKIVPLKNDEFLDYTYSQTQNVLTIYKANGSDKQICFENDEALWGGYQISKDKKIMIFWNDTFERNMPLYYLNGNSGEIKFIGKLPLNARIDRTGKYLMYEGVYQSGIFTILNLQTGKVEKELNWNILNKSKWIKYGGTFSVLKSADKNEYDFIILFEIENLSIAKAYVKISSSLIITEFDDSNLSEKKLRKSVDYQSEYTGWY